MTDIIDLTSGDADGRRLRVLVLAASLRSASLNAALATVAAGLVAERGAVVDRAAMADFDVPAYDGDVEAAHGVPAGAHAFKQRLEAADALVLASPEYNASMPGVLKNLVDWTSRFRPQPFNGRHCFLLSASPSMVGGNRGLWALRVPLEHLGARVYPDMFSLAKANDMLRDDGQLADEQLRLRLAATLTSFLAEVEAVTHYPCAKKAWVEFLGEQSDVATNRAQ